MSKEYYIYYNDGINHEIRNDPENNGPPSSSGHNSHGGHIVPSNHHSMNHNSTSYNEYNDFYLLINIIFNVLFFLLIIDIFRKCYYRLYRTTQITSQRLIETPEYSHTRVIIKDNIEEEICSICLEKLYSEEDIESNYDIIQLNCKHMFHKECLDPWIVNNKNCPLCKNNL